MPEDGAKKSYRLALQITAIVLLLAVLAGILVSEHWRMASDLTLVRAESVTVEERFTAAGYVFRAETVLKSEKNGVLRYAQRSGTQVAAGDLLFTAWDGERDDRIVGDILGAELDFWRELAAAEEPWQEAYFEAYESLMAACTANGAENLTEEARALLAALERKEADKDAMALRIAALERELDALIAVSDGAPASMYAPTDGMFYRELDGFEEVLTLSALEGLTPAALQALLATPTADASRVGKLVADEATLAVAVPSEMAEAFAIGQAYSLLFNDESLTLPLTGRSAVDEAGEVLLSFALPALYAGSRRVSVSFPSGSHTGIRVPMAAVEREGEEWFVYVAVEGKATRRSFVPVLYRDGYCLAAMPAGAGELSVGDDIVLTSRRIYEGKVLK